MFNFISEYIDYYKELESPDVFWYWSAITLLAGIMRDNIYLEFHDDRIYPNVFTILLADSGIYRKATPCRRAADFIRKIGNTRLISGRNSIQAAVKELGEDTTNERGDLISGASAVLYNEELSSFLVKDDQAVSLLTTLYDYHEEWSDTLLSRGRVDLKNVCVSLLSASNTSLFDSIYTPEAIEGGLLGRTFIIRPTQKRPRKSFFSFEEKKRSNEHLVNHLRKLAKIHGPVRYSSAAIAWYNDWYYNIPDHVFEDKIGFGSRLGTHVFKVSLALAAARENFDLVVEQQDVYNAIDACMLLRKNYNDITLSSGISSRSKQIAIVLQIFLKKKDFQITRAELIQRTLGDIEGEILDSILTYLEGAEMIRGHEVRRGMVGYTLTKKAHDVLLGDEENEL